MEPDMTIPVTNHDFTAEACADRLQKVLDTLPLKVTVTGGGLPPEHDPQALSWDRVVLIDRAELVEAIRHLRRADPATVVASEVP